MSRYERQTDFGALQDAGTKLTADHLEAEFDAILESVNAVSADQLSDGEVGTAALEDASVTEAKIADSSVTYAKHAANSVASDKAMIYESADTVIANGATNAFSHGIVDSTGAARAPKVVMALRKDTITGYYYPDEQIGFVISSTAVTVYNGTGSSQTVKVVAF